MTPLPTNRNTEVEDLREEVYRLNRERDAAVAEVEQLHLEIERYQISGPYEMGERHAEAAFMARISGALTIEPCHVTGEHDPTHTPRYVCSLQTRETLTRVIAALGLDLAILPRRLHDNCSWCTEAPELQSWVDAQAVVVATSAAPAPDVPTP